MPTVSKTSLTQSSGRWPFLLDLADARGDKGPVGPELETDRHAMSSGGKRSTETRRSAHGRQRHVPWDTKATFQAHRRRAVPAGDAWVERPVPKHPSCLTCSCTRGRRRRVWPVNIEEFYDGDQRRRTSPEVNYGKSWGDPEGQGRITWQVNWLSETGEVYALSQRTPNPIAASDATHPAMAAREAVQQRGESPGSSHQSGEARRTSGRMAASR
jgi:hypothetical protein